MDFNWCMDIDEEHLFKYKALADDLNYLLMTKGKGWIINMALHMVSNIRYMLWNIEWKLKWYIDS